MEKVVLFWIVFVVIAFAFALAVQMRMMIAIVLRRALKAWKPELEDQVLANGAVIAAASSNQVRVEDEPLQQTATAHLIETYPQPLRHLRLARRVSVITPVMILALLLVGRFSLGVI
ncbi:MAG: hypothetical protein AAF768_06105 [Pseudomonadota bacterium]